MKKITIKDIAKAVGVSTATVSRALSGKDHVSTETKRKILEVSEKLGYNYERKILKRHLLR
jgi:LacI family transcriptional regulator